MSVVYLWLQLTAQLLLLKLSDQASGHWGEWGPMSPCSATCGPGSQQKLRVWIHDPADGTKAQEKWTSTQSFACTNEKYPNCPEDGRWTGWTGWSGCTKACGSGIRDRTRECYGQLYGGKNCEGESAQKEDCNQDPCPPLPKKFDMLQCKEEYNFTCQSKKMCIPGIQKCDGTVHCHDGSDEMNCPIYRGQQGYIYYDLRTRNDGFSCHLSNTVLSLGLIIIKFVCLFIT